MLELKDITKEYKTANEKVKALKGISLKFRESEFVSILGQSGCGKTTLLNIVGGLDRYTTGDLIIDGKSTKKFKDRDWDAYRNHKVGFVFQSYNLISHQTVLSNVELALTIAGMSKKDRRKKAIKALEQVGLKEHINKKPNQLSGGQMQRVAIARALVNDPEIILADEPTGALDTKTSVQIMDILKKISSDRLIVMVTHNPELAEKYSSRIIKILDGKITEDSNPVKGEELKEEKKEAKKKGKKAKIGRASMSFLTALKLSLNNLLTKKGRTILVSLAGSIGIIGIALVQAVSNGFQGYVDHIEADTLTSYPLTIMEESSDMTSMILSMTGALDEKNSEEISDNELKEEQYITKMLDSISTNDLKSFKKYITDNYDDIKDDVTSIQYAYSIQPNIYGIDTKDRVAKLNPSNFFGSAMSGINIMGQSMGTTYNQLYASNETINKSYDVLAGRIPENYDELMIVLSEKGKISDYLLYSLGLRDTEELKNVISKMMAGETVEINNEPIKMTYEELMNTELKLVLPADIYKWNDKYDVYEDMSKDEDYMRDVYNNKGTKLKIVGVIAPKEGENSMAVDPGVVFSPKLIDYIINQSKNTELVQKQLENKEVDVLSGKRFDDPDDNKNMDFSNIMSIDTNMLQSAFDIHIDEAEMRAISEKYMTEINNAIVIDTEPAHQAVINNLKVLSNGVFNSVPDGFEQEEINTIVDNYLESYEPGQIFSELESTYMVPKDVYKTLYSGLLKGLMNIYAGSYKAMNVGMSSIPDTSANTVGNQVSTAVVNNKIPIVEDLKNNIITTYISNAEINAAAEELAKPMTEAKVKVNVMTKVGELTAELTQTFAKAFNIDQSKIAGAFKMNISEDEISRIVSSMMSETKTSAKANLINFGYQEKDEPTFIAFYFKDFDGKDHFKEFVNKYNEEVKAAGEEDKEINYSDTTGLLMGSVKTIVNAVTYVLIAFISISLVVSSIMIGIITYISVYERTKEIGILRAIGASKKNVSSIFNAETFIIGFLSGLFGIAISYLMLIPINSILHHLTNNIPLTAAIYPVNAIALVILSVILTLIGGIIPSKSAAKRDPVIALRTE